MSDGSPPKSLAHDRLADRFDRLMNEYDLSRRLETLLDGFLGDMDLSGKLVLDGGCGTGRATRVLAQRHAIVIPIDIGMRLVMRTAQLGRPTAVASVLACPFPDDCFDVVFSSEVIEHTPDPPGAVAEFHRILKPRGHLVLSTPNSAWHWLVSLAGAVKARPYDGFENFLSPRELRDTIEGLDMQVVEHVGLHIAPFQLRPIQPILKRVDAWGEPLLPLMINQCIHAIKR